MGLDLGRFKSNKNEDWVDWLADDPVPASLRTRMRQKAVQDASRPVVRHPGQGPQQTAAAQQLPQKPAKTPGAHSVSIHISVPKFKKLTLPKKLPKLPKNLTYKQLGIGTGAFVSVLVVGVIATHAHNSGKNKPGSTGVLSAANEKPRFGYSLPSGSDHAVKAEDIRFDPQRKVVNYKDSIGGIEITISQQPLPDNLKKDTDNGVKKLAEGFSAKEVLSTANPTAYLGTSVKGPQTVIFVKKDLLVFIQSIKKIDNHDWAEYITNLK